jgi:hypothetical protein
MSGKLDQSLDEILSSTRRTASRGGKTAVARRRSRTSKPAVAAPVGGVKKNPKGAKAAVKAIPTGPSGGSGESKIMVSNLVSRKLSLRLVFNILTFYLAQGCYRRYGEGMLSMRQLLSLEFCRTPLPSSATVHDLPTRSSASNLRGQYVCPGDHTTMTPSLLLLDPMKHLLDEVELVIVLHKL